MPMPLPPVEEYRTEAFTALGFDGEQSTALSKAKETTVMSDGRTYENHMPVYKVEQLLKQGCSHDLVVRILT